MFSHQLKMTYIRCLGFILLAASTPFCLIRFGLALNLTPSMPMGLYKRLKENEIQRYDIVASCLTKQLNQAGYQRAYLPAGFCPGGGTPVLKRIVAIPGDDVLVQSERILVNDVAHYAPRLRVDRHGHGIKPLIEQGAYLNTQLYWLLGDERGRSWDSRYYGGVSLSNILGRYKRVNFYALFVWTDSRIRSLIDWSTNHKINSWLSDVNTLLCMSFKVIQHCTTSYFLKKNFLPSPSQRTVKMTRAGTGAGAVLEKDKRWVVNGI